MEKFLDDVKKYLQNNNLNYEASIENKIIFKNLILKDENGDQKIIKIEPLKINPPANMCHSSIPYIKIDPLQQTDKWMNEVLNSPQPGSRPKIK